MAGVAIAEVEQRDSRESGAAAMNSEGNKTNRRLYSYDLALHRRDNI